MNCWFPIPLEVVTEGERCQPYATLPSNWLRQTTSRKVQSEAQHDTKVLLCCWKVSKKLRFKCFSAGAKVTSDRFRSWQKLFARNEPSPTKVFYSTTTLVPTPKEPPPKVAEVRDLAPYQRNYSALWGMTFEVIRNLVGNRSRCRLPSPVDATVLGQYKGKAIGRFGIFFVGFCSFCTKRVIFWSE